MNEKYIFIDIIHLHYIFHSCTVSENNGNLNLATKFLFGFLLFAVFYDNVIAIRCRSAYVYHMI